MIELTRISYTGENTILINPKHIRYIQKYDSEAEIYLENNHYIHVKESFDEVRLKIQNAI